MRQLNINIAGKKRQVPAFFLVAALILAIAAGITFAKYVLQKNHSGVAEAEPFYFTSDLLKEGAEEKVYHIDPKTQEFEITLFNYADSSRITQEEITGTVTVSGGTCSPSEFVIAGGTVKGQKVTITPNDTVVTVTATSSKPYQKTLSAKFQREAGDQYKIQDTADARAAVLTITLTGTPPNKGFIIKAPENVVPDATNELVGKGENGSYTFTPKESGVYSLILLKKSAGMDLSKAETDIGGSNEITVGQ